MKSRARVIDGVSNSKAARNGQLLPRHVGSFIGGQEYCGVADFFGLAPAFQTQ